MNPRKLLPVLSLAAALVWTSAAPAAASCVMLGPLADGIREADTVFVGTVDSADETGRVANVIVESVWKGDADEHVQVQGGPADPQMATSVDRGFDVGTRYLFVPVSGDGQVFTDNICSHTQAWKGKLARHAPDGATPIDGPAPGVDPQAEAAADEGGLAGAPASDPSEPERSSLGWVVWTAMAALAVFAAVAVVARQRSRAASAA